MPRKFNFWFIGIVLIYSTYDYIEHVLRENSTFNQHPFDWFLFSAISISFLVLTVLLIKQVLDKVFIKGGLLNEVAAIAVWLIIHINLFVPVFNKLFWPYDQLHFSFKLSAFFIILIIYFVIRVIINLLFRKKVF